MRILSVNTNDFHGGAARAAIRIMHGVHQHGIENQMLVIEKFTQDASIVLLQQFLPHNKLYRIVDWIVKN